MILAIAMATALSAARDPAVTQRTIDRTICRPHYTEEVRPSPAYIRAWERLHLKAGQRARDFTVDHRLSLSLGGKPRDPNLQLQTNAEAKAKDKAEVRLHALVCKRKMKLRAAQWEIWGWRP